jgi:hypothetical protein
VLPLEITVSATKIKLCSTLRLAKKRIETKSGWLQTQNCHIEQVIANAKNVTERNESQELAGTAKLRRKLPGQQQIRDHGNGWGRQQEHERQGAAQR